MYCSCWPSPGEAEAGGREPQAGHPLQQAEAAMSVTWDTAGAAHHTAAHLAVRLPVLHAGSTVTHTIDDDKDNILSGYLRIDCWRILCGDVRLHAWCQGSSSTCPAASMSLTVSLCFYCSPILLLFQGVYVEYQK